MYIYRGCHIRILEFLKCMCTVTKKDTRMLFVGGEMPHKENPL
jgi:hypothetical protein